MGGLVNALNELQLADHMIYKIMPLLNDKQVFINAVNHLSNAIKIVIKEYLIRETDYKRIQVMPSDELLINEFINNHSTIKGLANYNEMIRNIYIFNKLTNNSSIKLKKNDKFIMISPDYTMATLSIEQVKEYLIKAKELINKISNL